MKPAVRLLNTPWAAAVVATAALALATTPARSRVIPGGGNLTYLLPTGLGKQFVRLLVTPTP